jgi:DNA-binding CsgD family transcriptional regulator/tetratricopeptide (TPR) repeat protein
VEDLRPLVCPILVGRDDLLALADRRIAEISSGTGHLLLVAGEAGLGKTRLLGAIERRAAAAGFRVVRAGTYPSDLQVPAALLIDLSRALQREPELASLGTRLAERLADDTSHERDPGRRRRLLVLDVADLLAEIAELEGARTLIGLEDLHWSDDLTLEILEAFARRIGELPVLVVATYRSDELYPRVPTRQWRARLVAQRRAEEIRLRRLSAEETATMTAVIQGASVPPARDVVEAIHARTDGIPLHVEELLALLRGREVATAGEVREADVPETVEDAILARIGQRSPSAATIARTGAVIGRSFDLDLLCAVTGEPLDGLSGPLRELADHFILLPSHVPGRYAFRHALICDAIYAAVPEPERRRLHGLTAEAAAGRADIGTDAFLALHFERAGRRDDAFRAARTAADAAARLSSHTEARELYATALRTAPVELPADARARLLVSFGTSAAATDDNAAASEAFEAARAAWLEAGRPLDASAVVAPLVAARHLLGDPLESRAARLRDALGEIQVPPSLHGPPIDPEADGVRVKLLAALAAAYMLDRRLEDGIRFARDARDLAAQLDDAATERHAATTLGACYVFAGRMDEGWELMTGAVTAAREGGDEAGVARAYRMLGSCASVLVEYERGETWLHEGIEYAERVERWNDRHYMAAHLAHVLWATGRWAEADAVARRALADGRGGITTRLTALYVLGYLAVGQGRPVDAESAFGEAYELASGMREVQRISPVLWGMAEAALTAGDAATATTHVLAGLDASEAVGDAAYLFPYLVTGVRAFLELGDPGAARRFVGRAAPLIRHRGVPGTLPALDHAEGLLALAEGSTGRARTALAAAADGWSARGRVWEETQALVDLGRARFRAHQRAEASAAAESARSRAVGLPAPALEAAATALLATTRRGGEFDPWAPLTAREFEVARLVTDGRTNVEIGQELGISRKTVSAHLEHIFAKLGIGRRAEIAAWTASRPVLHSRSHGDDREE